jgi:hypothetical protein
MIDIREMTDLRELDPVELAAVAGGDGVTTTQGPNYTNGPLYPPVKPVPQYEM